MNHLLKEHKILTSFSVRQKMTSKEFLKIYKSIDANSHSESEIRDKFQKLMEQKSLEEIPGAISFNKEQIRLQQLIETGNSISDFIKNDHLTQKEKVVLLNIIAKNLGLTSNDS